MANKEYNPDVLNCIANLSNDEVFTPPVLANQVLDILPQELFCSPDTKFLDPFCKSGVFLREIVKRLDRGLADKIPDRQERIDHIMHHQVYGIALTELTSLLSRRTLYCSKSANSPHSVCHFDDEQGHLWYKAIPHTWVNGKCKYCGASKEVYDRGSESEQYAYQFIHTDNPKTLFPKDMKFDVIIGNPPYQLSDGGAQASATPIYNLFIEQAKKLKPFYLIMIIPARWYGGGKGLDDFRLTMINDKHIRILHDYLNAALCFPGVEIKGGVCYFLWDSSYNGMCKIYTHSETNVKEQKQRYLKESNSEIFIRNEEGIGILHKVRKINEKTFDSLVSSQKPFGLRTFVQGEKKPFIGSVTLFQNGGVGYIKRSNIERNQSWVDEHKVFVSRAYNAGDNYPHQIIGKPIYGAPNSCCTETYVMIGPFANGSFAKNVISYIQTRFFRYLVSLSKVSQMAPAKVYQFVPLQDFSHPWTDEMLYEKYGLDENEIAFIESMIRPME